MQKRQVPSAPFKTILELKLDEIAARPDVDNPRHQLSLETGIGERTMRRLLNEGQESIGFDKADLIVTRILGPMAWHTDEALHEIYMAADLAAVDRAYPVTQTVAA